MEWCWRVVSVGDVFMGVWETGECMRSVIRALGV